MSHTNKTISPNLQYCRALPSSNKKGESLSCLDPNKAIKQRFTWSTLLCHLSWKGYMQTTINIEDKILEIAYIRNLDSSTLVCVCTEHKRMDHSPASISHAL